MKCPKSYRDGPYWYRRVKVIEEYVCPKCDEVHRRERQHNDEPTRSPVTCPSCGFTKNC